ncbi:phosphodiesterase [Glaciibacter superstes]|uniref:phosphodiesterase n=1 Tax=Glaciibacter superstes TaxID=501023 RepID=UPI0003B44A74|nr:phosphodiesterase [Glaciibacter superstes]
MPTVQLGQHAAASQLIVHISDTHYLSEGRALYDRVDTDRTLQRALAQLELTGLQPSAIVLTGDITDRGEPDAYRRVRDQVEIAADRLGATVVWVMGNHDERSAFRTELLREAGTAEPVDRVFDIGGLRIIALDTSVPGFHHGDVSEQQRAWLADVLSSPAELGSILALHHPPVPTPLHLMNILELREQDSLAEVVAGSDIRAILGGHLHYATTGMFAGIPVSVAAATCYTMDLSAPERELTGVDGGQSINLVNVYADQVTHSVVPIGAFKPVSGFNSDFLDRMEELSADERTEAFSRQV